MLLNLAGTERGPLQKNYPIYHKPPIKNPLVHHSGWTLRLALSMYTTIP
uniref:Uncharacterized protein n=1 Tax=Arundo donax TaxID=35708 RepID=A0A0A9FCE5_ARUDO